MLAGLRRQYDLGVDPLAVLRALLETVHGVTLAKVGTPPDPSLSVEERRAREQWAGALSFALLHRLWQLLLRGHDEVARAALPIEAAEMALLRVVHASTLPDPGELARQLASGAAPTIAAPAPAPSLPASATTATAPAFPADWRALVEAIDAAGSLALAIKLKLANPVRYAPPELALRGGSLSAETLADLQAALKAMTGRPWKVTLADEPGTTSLRDQERQAEEAARAAILATPIVHAALAAFPGAEIERWPLPEQRSAM